MDTPYFTIHQRGLQGFYAAEKQRRTALEEAYQQLIHLLEDLARQHDGIALESARREDPRMPNGWTTQDWRRFFTTPAQAPVALPSSWDSPLPVPNGTQEVSLPTPKDTAQLILEIEGLKAKNQVLIAEVRTLRDELHAPTPRSLTPSPGKPSSTPVPHPSRRSPLTGFQPPACPLSWATRLNGLKDLSWRRGMMLMSALAQQGLNSFLEISRQITDAENLSDRSNSVRQPLEKLEKAELVISKTLTLQLGSKDTALKLIRLTPRGEEFCRSVGWEPEESEWHRLIRLHEGTRFPEHTAAVLAFAMNARARGWQVSVLPEVSGHAAPDVQVRQGSEQHYVEVELGLKDRPAKWRNLAGLQGHVALCARDEAGRARLVGDCRLARLPGMATDLESLALRVAYRDLTSDAPLWLEQWN